MFHQNLILWKNKSSVISWITGLFLFGCPDGTPYKKPPIMEYLRM